MPKNEQKVSGDLIVENNLDFGGVLTKNGVPFGDWVKISETVLSVDTPIVNIPGLDFSTYRAIKLLCNFRNTVGPALIAFWFNADNNGANYDIITRGFTQNSGLQDAYSGGSFAIGFLADTAGSLEVTLLGDKPYAFIDGLLDSGAGNGLADLRAVLRWNAPAPLSSINLDASDSGGSVLAGSKFMLYGLR